MEPQTGRSALCGHDLLKRPAANYIYEANGVNEHINVLLRSTLEVLTTFGDGGRVPASSSGWPHLATDSKRNLYVTEHTPAHAFNVSFRVSAPWKRTKACRGQKATVMTQNAAASSFCPINTA